MTISQEKIFMVFCKPCNKLIAIVTEKSIANFIEREHIMQYHKLAKIEVLE